MSVAVKGTLLVKHLIVHGGGVAEFGGRAGHVSGLEGLTSCLSSCRSEDCWRLWLLRACRRKMSTKAHARFNVGIGIICDSVPL